MRLDRLGLSILIILGVFFLTVNAECWQNDNETACLNDQSYDCQWQQDDWGGWCEEKGCWNLWSQSQCTSDSDDLSCLWKSSSSSGWCEETSCYTWEGTNASTCENNSEGLACQWENNCFGYNSNTDCWSLSTPSECNNVTGCNWGMCEEIGCWNYDYTNADTCQNHTGSNGYPCHWEGNSENGYCYESGCWDYDNLNKTACENNPLNLSCEWDSINGYCNEIECWSFDYTNESQCETYASSQYNLSCDWDGQWCMSSGCWDYYTESGCSNAQGCSWQTDTSGGWCEEAACWSFDQWNGGTEAKCNGTEIEGVTDASDFNLSCTWDNGACYANIDENCSTFTTEMDCMDTYYCWWECSDWNDQSTCTCKDPQDTGGWEDDGFFEKWNPGCYIFDIMDDLCDYYDNSNESNCTNNTDSLNIPYDCAWDAGSSTCNAISDCEKIIGCDFDNSTGLCDPESGDPHNIQSNGINCSLINDTQVCNDIPALFTCCEWKNGSCQEKLGKGCWENMDQKKNEEYDGIESCADVSVLQNPSAKCKELAGSPLFMPCEWNNLTSKCEFKSDKVFGNDSWTLSSIQNKKVCESAGGKWVQEWYCEGNNSVPAGRCEQKADEETNCNVACYACDYQFDGTNWTNRSDAKTACYGSDLGYCAFTSDSTAENGFGKCRAKEAFKSGIATDCTSDCGSCTYMGNPNAASPSDGSKYADCNSPKCYCERAKNFNNVTCKWVPDTDSTTIGGYCTASTTKTCQDSCDRCYTKSDCNNNGRKTFNATGSCEWVTESGAVSTSDTEGLCRKKGSDEVCWDGIDNDGDGLIDCGDNNCFADSFCGFVQGDCPSIDTQSSCESTQLDNGMNCTWVTDMWGGYCDFPGADCYSKDGTNETYCEAGGICEWTSGQGGGWCEQDWNSAESCWDKMTESTCSNTTNCTWTNDTWCNENSDDQWCQDFGGWCDPDAFAPKNCWEKDGTNQSACEEHSAACVWYNDTQLCEEEGCWNYDFNQTACNQQDNCQWEDDDWQQCEVDWSADCWKYDNNATQCNASSSCTWFENGNWSWCGNKYDRCWEYSENECGQHSDTCYWTDWDKCEAICYNDSLTESMCNSEDMPGCAWSSGWCSDTAMGGSTGGVECWQYDGSQGNCTNTSGCVWKNSGWCDPKGFSGGGTGSSTSGDSGSECWQYDGNQSMCTNSSAIGMTCSWIPEPWPFCEPDWSSDCMQYDGNQSACETAGCWFVNSTGNEWCMNSNEQCFMNDSLNTSATCNANPNCNWSSFHIGCEPDWNTLDACWQYNESQCNANNDTCNWAYDGGEYMCRSKFEACFQSMTETECNNHSSVCFWNDEMGGGWCDPICFNKTEGTCGSEAGCEYVDGSCEPSAFMAPSETACNNMSGNWINGWCNPPGMGGMFKGMDMAPPVMIAQAECNENGNAPHADLCGIGLKDTGTSLSFASSTGSFIEAGVCNGENVITMDSDDFGMGSANQGSGSETVKYYVYLDTDGSRTGGCAPSNNKSDKGYEFFLKLVSEYNNTLSKATQTFTAKRCSSTGSTWKIADVGLNTWKQKMCSMVGGPLIAVTKSDLEKFPTLYDSSQDMRIYATAASGTKNATSPSSTAGPGWFTPGTVDFELQNMFGVNVDSAKNEEIMKKGYVEHEDCYATGDEDDDGVADCYDWDCQYAKGCENSGVNAANYTDTSMPKITGIKVEEYTDAALIMYSSNKPTNGTLTFYGTDSTCGSVNDSIYDKGTYVSGMRAHKLWHDARIYNDSDVHSLNYSLQNNTNYYYKLKVCDSGGKCSVSKCSSFKTAGDRCSYCKFVTLINSPTGWTVSYDLNIDETYEHIQGQECGSKAGMKTNYTSGRKANIKLSEDGTVVEMEFINVTLTKTGLTSKTRKISTSGDLIHNSTEDYVGMPSGTRDKIINNLHPELCKVTIPTSGGNCSALYHCDDQGNNCTDRTSESELLANTSTSCTWEIPYCEFSTWDADGNTEDSGDDDTGDDITSPGGSSGGGGGAPTESTSETKIWSIISEGTKAEMNLNTSALAIKYVGMSVENTLENVELKVAKMSSSSSAGASEDVPGNAFQYMKITPTLITNEDISEAEIKFEVDKSWITDNNIDENKIYLYRWANAEWNKLETALLQKGSSVYSYTATSPGFSAFAISGEKKVTEAAAPEDIPEEDIQDIEDIQESSITTQVSAWLENKMIIAFIGIIAIVLVIAGIVYHTKFQR